MLLVTSVTIIDPTAIKRLAELRAGLRADSSDTTLTVAVLAAVHLIDLSEETVDEVIESAQPALWVHGHTHSSADYQVGDTRVVCNPYGYYRHEVNTEFASVVVDLKGDA